MTTRDPKNAVVANVAPAPSPRAGSASAMAAMATPNSNTDTVSATTPPSLGIAETAGPTNTTADARAVFDAFRDPALTRALIERIHALAGDLSLIHI